MKTATVLPIALLAFASSVEAFTTNGLSVRQSTCTTLMARGGRGKKGKKSRGGMDSAGQSATDPGVASANWVAIPAPAFDFSKAKDGKVELFDTNLVTLKDSLTNPTGAVSVLKHKGEVFCFDAACPSCKIPLAKATVLPVTSSRPTPTLTCSFCKSSYDLRSGQKTEVSADEAGGGLFAGLAQNLFKASGNTDPLKIHQLGEKDGKMLITLD
ncbi:expressed unknown protein [Seminavis robusta]|uniref:Rieske domain-containing protein n=1 Tax=Seminavis robusta TaxID=568900 RepID=A0A9N8DC24_9STRA|nr:expressed unknown protein [Seminavis robusta]|eukprot:Sro79_g042860.1 n/a (213) ;mRNA; f:104883-105521